MFLFIYAEPFLCDLLWKEKRLSIKKCVGIDSRKLNDIVQNTQEKIVKGQERRALNLYVREEERVVERERGEKKGERGRDKDDIGNMLGKYQTY